MTCTRLVTGTNPKSAVCRYEKAESLTARHQVSVKKGQGLGPGIPGGTRLVVVVFINKGVANAGIDSYLIINIQAV